ncbi:D-glycero-D-manno-heptose 7-phosphate kinase [Burkholderia pseudomallei 305]|nr:D-glycero-D-manno-heptose 7-phosphate kinase [Burkholderia pseudomallei 305]
MAYRSGVVIDFRSAPGERQAADREAAPAQSWPRVIRKRPRPRSPVVPIASVHFATSSAWPSAFILPRSRSTRASANAFHTTVVASRRIPTDTKLAPLRVGIGMRRPYRVQSSFLCRSTVNRAWPRRACPPPRA